MAVGQQVVKFTWLLDNVEVKGIVKAWDPNNNRLPDGSEVGTGDSFDVEPDENYRHLISYVPGFGPWVQCETYPVGDPSVGTINRIEPWFLPQKSVSAPFVVRDTATGLQVPLKVGDHVQVVGRWVIDHHPEHCETRTRGWLKVGCVHIEFHPFRWDDIRLVRDLDPGEFEEETVSVAAPLHTEVYLGGEKWLANEIAGVASKIFITEDGANYYSTVMASTYIKAPKLPAGFTPHRSLIGFQEEVRANGTGQDIAQVRSLELVDEGLKVTATVNAPRTMQFDNLVVADVNDPANLRSIFQARYRVWWQPRLVFIDQQGGSPARLELAPQAAGSATRFGVFVKNRGPDPLQITDVSLIDDPQQVFQIDPASSTMLPPGIAMDLNGTFTPTNAGVFDGTLVVTSNDPAHGHISIRITGVGVARASRPAVCSTDPSQDRLDIFARGADNAVHYRWFGGNPWTGAPWQSLGGVVTSDPTAVALGPGLVYVFARGVDNALYYKWLSRGAPADWHNLGGVLTSGPAACSTGSQRLDVFVRGTDNTIYYKWSDGSNWSDWHSLGGVFTSDPVAMALRESAWIFARGTDEAIYFRWVRSGDPANSSGWQRLEGRWTSAPAACSPDPDHDVFDVFTRGTDNALWHNRFTGSAWSGWQSLGGVLVSAPSAMTMNGASWVVVRGTDSAFYFMWLRSPSDRSEWQRLEGPVP